MTDTPKPKPTPKSSRTSPRPAPPSAGSGPVLFVVESPVKQRTITKLLGDDFIVRATYGHIADIPESDKSIDVENGFAAEYRLIDKGAEVIEQMRNDLAGCSKVVVATDPDREGEMIAAHVVEFLAPSVPVERIDLGALTAEGLTQALANPRDIDWNLVAAARARRILDMVFGFRVSNVARKKIRKNATAGRVQSPAVRLVVERELERLAHVAAVYWDVQFASATVPSFDARLTAIDSFKVATGGDFDASGVLTAERVHVGPVQASTIAEGLVNGWTVTVVDITEKEATRNPRPPHTLSSLLQDASSRLGMGAKEAGDIAQELFNKGHITYPRTDIAVHHGPSRAAIKATIRELFGADGVHPKDRWTTASGKNAQGAHEAIRPTRLADRVPAGLTKRQRDLYDLIWRRTIASQMASAKGFTRTITMQSTGAGMVCDFTVSGTTYTEVGFLAVWGRDGDDDPGLPALSVGDVVPVASAEPKEHTTQPPARFNDGTLVEALEKAGVGRPSTYASTITKLRDRFVFSKRGDRALIPTVTAFAVNHLLTTSFAPFVNLDYTSQLEERLDNVAEGELDDVSVLSEFFFGDDDSDGLDTLIEKCLSDINPRDMWALQLGELPGSGETIVVRPGRMMGGTFRPYIEAGSEMLTIADETDFCALDMAELHAVLGSERDRELGEIDGAPVLVRRRLDSAFFQWGVKGTLAPGATKPLFGALLPSMNLVTVTLDDARLMLSLPRTVGVDPVTGDQIVAGVGKHGGYVASGEVRAKLSSPEQVFAVDVAEAAELLAAARVAKEKRGAKRASKPGSRRRSRR